MAQLQPFVQQFANLVWLLIHRPNAVDEQKAATRRALAQLQTRAYDVTLTDLNVFVAEAAQTRPLPEELPWIGELALKMAGHSVRALSFQQNASASDALGLARAIIQQAVVGDEGAAFDARVVGLGLTTINVHFGRGDRTFVRRPTPRVGSPAFAAPARTPSLGSQAIRPTPPTNASLQAHTPVAQAVAHGLDELFATEVAATSDDAISDESTNIFDTTLSASPSKDLEPLFVRVDSGMDTNDVGKSMEDLARTAEQRAGEGRWVDALAIYKRLLNLEDTDTDAKVKRAAIASVRRLNQPALLRGIAQLLPRRRELRDDAMLVLTRYGETASDVLVDLMATTDAATERKAYRVAITHCPSAVPALIHLLGDARWYVVRNAAELLGEMGVTESDGKLAQAMRHGDARVRRAAATALARLGTPRAQNALQQALADKVPAVRQQAAIGLSSIRNPRAVSSVIEALQTEEDPDVQTSLLTALGSMPTAESIERLRRAAEPGSLIKRKPTSVRLTALQALADAGTAAAFEALRGFVKDRDKDVKAKVERLLERRAVNA